MIFSYRREEMNLEHYKNFLKIVEIGTISGAAKDLLIAQPSLSKQVKVLEKEFGIALLKRNARQIELTNEGQIFYEKAKLICSLHEMAADEIKASILGNRGTLRLGFTPSYPDLYVEELLREFSLLQPEIIYEIHETSSDQIMDLIKNNTIEIGIVRTPSPINPLFKSYKAVEERLMAVFHKNNPWFSARVKSIPIQKLKGVPLSISRGFKEKIREIFSEAGFSPNLLSVSSSRPTTLMWAKQGKSVGIVTTTSSEILETEVLVCRPLTGGDMSAKRSFIILKEHNLSSVAKSFLRFATEDKKGKYDSSAGRRRDCST
jgi:DNA-binding transcriptional LysR family regulator